MPKTSYLLGILATAIAFLGACANSNLNSKSTAISGVTPIANEQSSALITSAQPKDSSLASSQTILLAKLTEPTSKTKRQQELATRVNYDRGNVGRDPFTTLPGSLNLPPVNIPAPIQIPVALPAANPQPLVSKPIRSVPKSTYTPPRKEAELMTISGAVEIGGDRYAIVSVPGEATSQYVRAGEKLAQDKVLVKYIEMSGTPKVILQQNGVEFVRYVGSSGN